MSKQGNEPKVSDTVTSTNIPHSPEDGAATDMISEFVKQTIDNIEHQFDGKSDNDQPSK